MNTIKVRLHRDGGVR